MKPIWIVDDDESIRWVLEKALARENLATRKLCQCARRAAGAASMERRRCWCRISACRANPGWTLLQHGQERASRPAGDHHHRVFRPRFGGRRVPGRRLRIPGQAVRCRQGGRADPARARRKPARGERGAGARRDARNPGPGAGHAGSVPRHRPPVAIECDGADHRRIRAPARNWWRARCTSTARAQRSLSSP